MQKVKMEIAMVEIRKEILAEEEVSKETDYLLVSLFDCCF